MTLFAANNMSSIMMASSFVTGHFSFSI